MRHLTRIVHVPVGVNILGLLEIFALIGSLFGVITLPDQIGKRVGGLVVVLAAVAIVVFDLWWRHSQPESSRWARLFSPFTGGCFVFIPIWLLLPVLAAAAAITALMTRV